MSFSCGIHGWQHMLNPCPSCNYGYTATNTTAVRDFPNDLREERNYWQRKYNENYDRLIRYSSDNKRLREALESISKNSCCGQCQEAKLVALAALGRPDETTNG